MDCQQELEQNRQNIAKGFIKKMQVYNRWTQNEWQ